MPRVVGRRGHLPLEITKAAVSPLACAEGPPAPDKVPGGAVEPTGQMKVYFSQKTAISVWREAPRLCQPCGEGGARTQVCGGHSVRPEASEHCGRRAEAPYGGGLHPSLRCAPQALWPGGGFQIGLSLKSFFIKLPS